MSKILAKDTLIERRVFSELRKRKIYFQKHYNRITGKPDVSQPKKKKAVFIDGDFWHGWKYSFMPRIKNHKYWGPKIGNNIRRDQGNRTKLKKDGWKVLRVWEHDIERNFDPTIKRIVKFLK